MMHNSVDLCTSYLEVIGRYLRKRHAIFRLVVARLAAGRCVPVQIFVSVRRAVVDRIRGFGKYGVEGITHIHLCACKQHP